MVMSGCFASRGRVILSCDDCILVPFFERFVSKVQQHADDQAQSPRDQNSNPSLIANFQCFCALGHLCSELVQDLPSASASLFISRGVTGGD